MDTGDDSGATKERTGASAGGERILQLRQEWNWGECGMAGEENAFPEGGDDNGRGSVAEDATGPRCLEVSAPPTGTPPPPPPTIDATLLL